MGYMISSSISEPATYPNCIVERRAPLYVHEILQDDVMTMSASHELQDSRAMLRMDMGFLQDSVVASSKVLMQDPCPLELPDTLTLAHMFLITRREVTRRRLRAQKTKRKTGSYKP